MKALFFVVVAVLLALPAFAQDPAAPASLPAEAVRARAWGSVLFFWSGAAVVMFLVARVVFREQLHQLRTQRMLIRQIGPFFPEFDTDHLTAWVNRLAPHIWRAWRSHSLEAVAEFLTPDFITEAQRRYVEEEAAGLVHEVAFEKVLKVHYLGLYLTTQGPPPKDLELVLRLEVKGIHGVRDAQGRQIAGSPAVRQVQQFWTLRHDGHRWRLHQVEPAQGDRTDLAKKPLPPPLMEWRRPAALADDSKGTA